jgi:hypothetical protein
VEEGVINFVICFKFLVIVLYYLDPYAIPLESGQSFVHARVHLKLPGKGPGRAEILICWPKLYQSKWGITVWDNRDIYNLYSRRHCRSITSICRDSSMLHPNKVIFIPQCNAPQQAHCPLNSLRSWQDGNEDNSELRIPLVKRNRVNEIDENTKHERGEVMRVISIM